MTWRLLTRTVVVWLSYAVTVSLLVALRYAVFGTQQFVTDWYGPWDPAELLGLPWHYLNIQWKVLVVEGVVVAVALETGSRALAWLAAVAVPVAFEAATMWTLLWLVAYEDGRWSFALQYLVPPATAGAVALLTARRWAQRWQQF